MGAHMPEMLSTMGNCAVCNKDVVVVVVVVVYHVMSKHSSGHFVLQIFHHPLSHLATNVALCMKL